METVNNYEFEWDEEKSQKNLLVRGFSFEYATLIFEDPDHVVIDVSRSEDHEKRYKAIRGIEGKRFIVVFTWRCARRRIISARRTNKQEDKYYEKMLYS